MPRHVAAPTSITQSWWDATRDQRLTVQACGKCGHLQHEPRVVCMACASSSELELRDVAGTGRVHSFTVIHRAPVDDVAVPYTVAIVELDEGVRLLTNIVDIDPAAVTCELPVTLTWEAIEDGRHLPLFRPSKA